MSHNKAFIGYTYAVSDKKDGNLSYKFGPFKQVRANREKFLLRHGVRPDQCVVMHAEHSDNVIRADKEMVGRGMNRLEDALMADALMTNQAGIILCLLTADCLPLSIIDQKHQAIALVHLGWKSTNLHLVKKVVIRMKEDFGSKPADLYVMMGPSIHQNSYIIDKPAQAIDEQWKPYIQRISDERYAIDIVKFNFDQLLQAGALKENIEDSSVDTGTSRNQFSHYREIRTGEAEGRFITILGVQG